MGMNIYEISRVNSTALFTRDEEVNNRLFDMVELFQNDASNAKHKAEICYEIVNAPCFAQNGACENTDPYKLIEATFGKLMTVSTARKYALIVSRFAKSDDPDLVTLYMTFPVGKLIIISPLTSDKNVKAGYTVKAFIASIGKAENDKVAETWHEWEKSNAETLQDISDFLEMGKDRLAEKARKQLTEEPEKPCADDDIFTLYNMGLAIIKKLSDSELKKRVVDYLPKKEEESNSQTDGQTDGQTNGQTDETPAEKTARLKAAAAAAMAEYIAAAAESGDKVTETVKQAARKLGADV